MKPVLSIASVLGVMAAMSVAAEAFAQHGEQRGGGRMHRERGEETRAAVAGRPGETPQEGPAPTAGYEMSLPQRRERMTLEERRQLRHDINEAGRDLYRPVRGVRP